MNRHVVQYPGKRGEKALPAVPGALAVPDLQQPPLQGQMIGGDRSKAVKPLAEEVRKTPCFLVSELSGGT
jgi:hypothetical protein